MARTAAQVAATIEEQLALSDVLVYVDPADNITKNITTNQSRRARWKAWKDVIAWCTVILEQLIDLYIVTIEAIVARSNAANAPWLQNAMFKFQYDATVPQVLQLVGLVPVYPIVDPSKQIITACAIKTAISNRVSIKVAKGSPLVALTSPEQAAAAAYANTIGTEGITYDLISLDANRIYIAANIYFNGQYAAVIKVNVIAAITAYFQQLSVTNFSGTLKMLDLEIQIRNVTGVTDVIMNNVKGRASTVALASAVPLILNGVVVQREYNPEAGYVIPEDTTSNTLSDTLTFIAV